MEQNCHKELPKVAVLMSTYNGEKFLKEQLDSILCQEGVDVDIFIRDDGSTDSTLEIISDYAKRDNVTLIPSDKNIGPSTSFLTLLYTVAKKKEYPYYAFADQDDIWLPQKLQVGIDHLCKYTEVPALYGSNRIIFENGINKGVLFKEKPNVSLQRNMSGNDVNGCTMVFNDRLAEQIVKNKMVPAEIIDYRMHDSWVALVALTTGELVYDSESYILYRIHEKNVVGLKNVSFCERVKHLSKKGNGRTERSNLRQKTAKQLLEYYPDMDKEKKAFLEKYAYYQESFKKKRELMADRDLIAATKEKPIVFKIKVLINFV